MVFRTALLASVVASLAFAGANYDASSGILPPAPFIYTGDSNVNGTNPSPSVTNGALQEDTTVGAQSWSVPDGSIDFSQHASVEANLHIISSNYVANIGSGTREGYYLAISDSAHSYSIGLASAGFNINSIEVPNQSLTAYPFIVTDTFHVYRLTVSGGAASFSIDGTLVATNIPPSVYDIGPAGGGVVFGGAAGASRSVTELKSFSYGTISIQIKLTKDQNPELPDWAMLAFATAIDSNGNAVDLKDAAQQSGFDHFNWIQFVVSDSGLTGCSQSPLTAVCAQAATISGTVPTLPFFDPPAGGFAYQYWQSLNASAGFNLCPGLNCPVFDSAINDYWPMYLDEYFAEGAAVCVGGQGPSCTDGKFDSAYLPSRGLPEYRFWYQTSKLLLLPIQQLPSSPVDPSQAYGFLFFDRPTTAGSGRNISFVTSLVGVNGICNTLSASNCTFQIVPNTTFHWTAANGTVFSQPLTFKETFKDLTFPIVNPVNLTGIELENAVTSISQFLELAGLTSQSLTTMGGSVANVSASLIPSQATALAKAPLRVPSSQISITSSGLSYSRVTQTFNGTLKVSNISGNMIIGPLQVVFFGMPSGVMLANATGNLSATPYMTVPTVVSLAPGQSATVSVQLKNPSNAVLNLTPVIYSGSIN